MPATLLHSLRNCCYEGQLEPLRDDARGRAWLGLSAEVVLVPARLARPGGIAAMHDVAIRDVARRSHRDTLLGRLRALLPDMAGSAPA